LDCNSNQLTESAVDQILADMVSNNYTGSNYKIIMLQGGANSAPSPDGLANKAILEGIGFNVLTN
jgi:hypothetical protein